MPEQLLEKKGQMMKKQEHILLIEDNQADADLFFEYISETKYKDADISHAENIKQSLELLAAHSFDIILIDLGLPDSTGLSSLTKTLKKSKNSPIVVLSGKDDLKTGEQAVIEGAEDYLVKGTIDENNLNRVITYSIERKKQKLALEKINRQLKEKEENLRTTLNSIGDAVISTDLDGNIVRMNPIAGELTGWSEDVAPGKPINQVFNIVDANTGETIENPVKRVLEEGKVVGLANHTLLISKDGSEYQIADSGAPIRNSAGEITGAVLVFGDVTETYRQQEALRESEERFDFALQATNTGLWDWNVQTGETTFTEQWAAIAGYILDELRPFSIQTWLDLSHPDDLTHSNALLQQHFRGETEDYECETRMWHKEGYWIWILDRGKVIEWDESGNPLRMIGTHTDITQSKQAEEEIRQSEARLNEAQRTAHLGNWELDLKTNHLKWSDEIYRIFEIDKDQFGASYEAFLNTIHPDDKERVNNAYTESLKNKTPYKIIHRLLMKDGRIKYVEEQCETKYDNSGKPICSIGTALDITEREQAKKTQAKLQNQIIQAQKMESVGRLAGGVAHDFNNLLMGIMGYAEMCADEIGDDHPTSEWLEQIRSASQRSANLTRQLLAFASKQTVAPKVMDLNEEIEGMLKMLRRLIGEDIDLAWQACSEPTTVKMDPTQVDQILANLCVNARDAIDDVGKITIETRNIAIDAAYCAEHTEAIPGDYIMLTVSDDGCGMDRDTLEHVFEPFYTTKGVSEGTGLGLATIYGIVKQNDGFVNVYSEPDQGTTFRIYLPRFAGEATNEKKDQSAGDLQGDGETILLAEDEPAIRDILGRLLEQLDYTVLAAEDPAQALRLVEEHLSACGDAEAGAGAIDLLFTDVVMPGMNGRDLADKLKQDYPDLKVIYMSGYSANVVAERGILEDGVDFLSKPISREDLAAKVREVLGR